VRAPTLLLVGGQDYVELEVNRRAEAALGSPGRLTNISGAGRLFDDPIALDRAAAAARDWFADHPAASPRPAPKTL
jgi:putative phosphoribosyl transferase